MLSNEGHSLVRITVLALAIITMVAAFAFAAWLDWRARRKPPNKTPQKPPGNARKSRQRRRK